MVYRGTAQDGEGRLWEQPEVDHDHALVLIVHMDGLLGAEPSLTKQEVLNQTQELHTEGSRQG